MRNLIKNLAKKTLYMSGYYHYKSNRVTRSGKRLLILMYHDFAPDELPAETKRPLQEKVTCSQFEAHIKAIKNNYRIITVEKAIREMMSEGGLKENSVAITFDDGYRSNYEVVYPLLKKYDIPVTIYLLIDWIDGRMTLWWDELADMVQAADLDRVNPEPIRKILGEKLRLPLVKIGNEYKNRVGFYEAVSLALMQMSDEVRPGKMEAIKKIILPEGEYPRQALKSMTWGQVKDMADNGIEFGAHTLSHINLSYADPEAAAREIEASKKALEWQLGKEIRGFAYPYGYDPPAYGRRIVPLLKEMKFDYACTSWWGNNKSLTDQFLLYRNSLPLLTSAALLGRELHLHMTEEGHPPFYI
ncbi:MAG: polysaccharide deacetylase family protein [Candidatus Zixiibacteriota bacterium]